MSKTLKKILALVLALTLLSVSAFAFATTASAATEDAETAETGSETVSNEGSFFDGWLTMEYVGNDILITVAPDRDDIFSTDGLKLEIEEIARFCLEISKNVVLDEFVEALAGDYTGLTSKELGERILRNLLGIYLEEHYGSADGMEDIDAVMDYLEEILKNTDENGNGIADGLDEVQELADLMCDFIEASVVARAMYISSYPFPEDFLGEITEIFEEEKHDIMVTFFRDQFDLFEEYVTDTTGEVAEPKLYDIIDKYAQAYLKDYIIDRIVDEEGLSYEDAEARYDDYINENPIGKDDYADYFNSESYDASIKDSVVNDINLYDIEGRDEALIHYFGMNMAQIDQRIAEIDALMYDAYVDVYSYINSGEAGPEDYFTLLGLVDNIFVTDTGLS